MTEGARYHHGGLRPALVATATELARAHGPDGVVLREAARRVGVSHNAAYRHFSDRDELLAEVARAALGELAEAMRVALDAEDRRLTPAATPGDRARGRLRALGRTYVEFALAEPGLFRTGFHGMLDEGPAGTEAFTYLGAALDDLVAAKVLPQDRHEGALLSCWAAVHGLSVLMLDGPLGALSDAEREHALGALLDQVEQGL